MEKRPEVFLIFATDATQELARLLEILQKYKRENRIQDFSTLEFHSTPTPITKSPLADDLIIVLLSNGLKIKIPELEKLLEDLKPETAGIKLAIIKVEDVEWSNQYLTYPLDLSSLSKHPQPDVAWDQIQKGLGELLSFPAPEAPGTTKALASPILFLFIVLLLLIGGWLIYEQYIREDPPDRNQPPVIIEEVEEDLGDATEEATAILPDEDCLSFEPAQITIEQYTDGFLVTGGQSQMLLFRDQGSAEKALQIIQHYKLNEHCFAIGPDPGLKYFKADGDLPSGSFSDEDCLAINNPDGLVINKASNDLFQVLDGNSMTYAAKTREEAERIIEVVQHYGARFTCYVGRPDPGMVYLKK